MALESKHKPTNPDAYALAKKKLGTLNRVNHRDIVQLPGKELRYYAKQAKRLAADLEDQYLVRLEQAH